MSQLKHIAVTGGTGHLGTAIILRLLERGFNVVAQYRMHKPTIENQNLQWIKGDLSDVEHLKELITGCEAMIHCAGLISIGEKSLSSLEKVNVTGTKNVIQVGLEYPNIRLIHISSSNAVQEFSENGVFNEEQEYATNKDLGYSYTKAKAEIEILNSVKNLRLDAVILRPTAIVGPPDFRHSLMGQTILDFVHKKFPILTTGGYDIVDLRDVAESAINSIELGKKGEVYLLGGHYVTVTELAKLSNPSYNPALIPIHVLLAFLPFINLYQKIFNTNLPITRESLLTLKNAPKKVDSSKAKRVLKHNPRPVKETITDLTTWFKTQK
jgi:dihydroflavonol-4-reductase